MIAFCSYSQYNLSAPRLPIGLSFSMILRPVTYRPGFGVPTYMPNLGNSTYVGLICPYLKLASDPDEPMYLLDWWLDPE